MPEKVRIDAFLGRVGVLYPCFLATLCHYFIDLLEGDGILLVAYYELAGRPVAEVELYILKGVRIYRYGPVLIPFAFSYVYPFLPEINILYVQIPELEPSHPRPGECLYYDPVPEGRGAQYNFPYLFLCQIIERLLSGL